jgi:ABC-2 type transport system ATP-binding protein
MSDHVIEVRNLSRLFGSLTALCDVSLQVPRGVVFGLVGENGAGKTTLIKHVLGLLRAVQGEVRVFDRDPVRDPVGVLSRIGYLSEERELPDWMRIGQLMEYTKAFYHTWDDRLAEQLREMFELARSQHIRSLSRGQRARAGLLVALAHRPDLLILDEPSSGLDPAARRDILAAIIRTVADEGRSVLMSSHLLEEVERVADSVTMLHRGQVVLSESLEDLLASHRRITIRFAEPLTESPELPETLSCTGRGREWTVLCNGEAEAVAQAAADLGATIVHEDAASLNEIFLARVGS